ncbi:hypothetical protein ACS0TY_018482 [Phlomoides rotata]
MGFHHHSLQFWLICSCFLGSTSAIDTISVNERVHDPDYIESSGGNFKLGFFSPPSSSYRYVGVMYNLPVMTVIWVANRDNPLKDSTGSLQISGDGNLVILDGRKEEVWSTNNSIQVSNSSTALLLDTGNLVLRDSSSSTTYIWESFGHASDSLLENMRVSTDLISNQRNELTSWKSASDPAAGSFTSTLELLQVPEFFVWKDGKIPFWRSGPWNNQIFIGIPYMFSFYKQGFKLVSSGGTGTSAYMYFTLGNFSGFLYYVLEPSGELLEKQWSDEKGDWEVTWTSMESECDVYGKCGPYGRCDSEAKPICRCFRGFVPAREEEWRAGNWSGGCSRRRGLQCNSDGFVKLGGVKPPDRLELFVELEQDCRLLCLGNCSCQGYAYSAGIGCMQWAGTTLIDVHKLSDGAGVDLYIRLAHSELGSGNKKQKNAIIATALVLGFVTLAVSTFFFYKFLLNYKGRKQQNEVTRPSNEDTDTGYSEENTLQHTIYGVKMDELFLFKFQMLSNATESFSLNNKLGQGGFGPVYKGKLGNGQEIAVKRLARSSNQGLEEFMNEVEVISRLQHRNLVRLLGCCVESEEKMLVYEYMPNGSLDSYLFDSRKRETLNWKTRMIIIEGICRGLLYLHRDSRLRIIHRDLKASNILLDEELNPKISDFGMARIFGGKVDEANTTRVVGTYGYMSPEYALHGMFSEKSDVYSFGVLLLETVSGRRNARFCDEDRQLFLIAHLPFPKQPAFVGIPRYFETEHSPKNSTTKYSANTVSVSIVEGR